jgi:hypothetical protein
LLEALGIVTVGFANFEPDPSAIPNTLAPGFLYDDPDEYSGYHFPSGIKNLLRIVKKSGFIVHITSIHARVTMQGHVWGNG